MTVVKGDTKTACGHSTSEGVVANDYLVCELGGDTHIEVAINYAILHHTGCVQIEITTTGRHKVGFGYADTAVVDSDVLRAAGIDANGLYGFECRINDRAVIAPDVQSLEAVAECAVIDGSVVALDIERAVDHPRNTTLVETAVAKCQVRPGPREATEVREAVIG